MSQSTTVRIYDREYALRSSEDPDRIQVLAKQVDRRMRELAESTGSVDTLKLAILTAISLSDDLLRAREDLREMDETVGRRSLECVTLLDRFLQKSA